jgi:hypothetical protein
LLDVDEEEMFHAGSELSARDIKLILTGAQMVVFEDESFVIREGHQNNSLFIVKSGSVAVVKGGAKVAEMGPGSIFGEMSVLAHLRPNVSIQAIKNVELYVVELSLIFELFRGKYVIVVVVSINLFSFFFFLLKKKRTAPVCRCDFGKELPANWRRESLVSMHQLTLPQLLPNQIRKRPRRRLLPSSKKTFSCFVLFLTQTTTTTKETTVSR